jgi:hypothetical protein
MLGPIAALPGQMGEGGGTVDRMLSGTAADFEQSTAPP